MMSLEALRIQLVDRMRDCRDPDAVAQLIADVESQLNASRIAEQAKRVFWDAVDHDLVVVTQEASVILERQGARTLRTTIDVARAALMRYREGLPSGSSR